MATSPTPHSVRTAETPPLYLILYSWWTLQENGIPLTQNPHNFVFNLRLLHRRSETSTKTDLRPSLVGYQLLRSTSSITRSLGFSVSSAVPVTRKLVRGDLAGNAGCCLHLLRLGKDMVNTYKYLNFDQATEWERLCLGVEFGSAHFGREPKPSNQRCLGHYFLQCW